MDVTEVGEGRADVINDARSRNHACVPLDALRFASLRFVRMGESDAKGMFHPNLGKPHLIYGPRLWVASPEPAIVNITEITSF